MIPTLRQKICPIPNGVALYLRIDFDPLTFGIPPQSLAAIEPSQLLSLLVAKQALENAGYLDGQFNAENVSVIIGRRRRQRPGQQLWLPLSVQTNIRRDARQNSDEALPNLTEDSFPGVLANVISGRITNRLNLGGGNYTVDAACASSIAAIDLACQELYLNKSDMVLAGGSRPAQWHQRLSDVLQHPCPFPQRPLRYLRFGGRWYCPG